MEQVGLKAKVELEGKQSPTELKGWRDEELLRPGSPWRRQGDV